MKQINLATKITTEVKKAIKDFGTYDFDDKGPWEVMEMEPLIENFQNLDLNEKINVARELNKNLRGSQVLIELLNESNLSEKDLNTVVEVSHPEVVDYFKPTRPWFKMEKRKK